jgi:hypothetical protein
MARAGARDEPAGQQRRVSRRRFLRTTGAAALATVASSGAASASHRRETPDKVTISEDPALIEPYQPQFIMEDVEPAPEGYFALHATHEDEPFNAVYGFLRYPYQDGRTAQDSHHLDHEPTVVYYDPDTGDVVHVDYSAWHWFRARASAEALTFTADGRPKLRVHPRYHHYLLTASGQSGTRYEPDSLVERIDGWLANGMSSELAVSQPYNPWDLRTRGSWWRRTLDNQIGVRLRALAFNFGFAPVDKSETDVSGVGL